MIYLYLTILVVAKLSLATDYDYGEVLEKSLLFYEAQRTGYLPLNNRVPWRGDSFVTDQGHDGEDLTGGFFDAGDHVKFGFPLASTITFLAWGMVDAKEGYVKAGQWENGLDCLKWAMDYFIKIHPSPNVLYVQVGNGTEDHQFWGRPEEWTGSNPRLALKATTELPASEVAGEQAAAMAAASMVFRENGDIQYANTLLAHAVQLYIFATTYRGRYSDSFPEIGGFYGSWAYGDELLYAAAWLFRATGKPVFRRDYTRFWTEFGLNYRPTEMSWDQKLPAAQILLAAVDGSPQYTNAAREFCDWYVYSAPRTPLGLVFFSMWGSLRMSANAAYVCLQAANAGINVEVYRTFAKSQIDYILGDTGRSFVVGFGVNPPLNPHHRASSCPDLPAVCDWNAFNSPDANPQTLFGALVGGPDINDVYVDDRADYVGNEVALDYNAAFQSAVAALCEIHC
ncbi:Endoglucanase E-4 [Pseudolycoriella hygida]|uniref:Endoglucanase n=1 Tax=Pseudolycoriella hygida TaxID=35572 RepID=A0A9Q0MLF4_9DIPT|nr:Endoglucanase E-4 [Pseudolycoriella hygida]